MIIKVTIGFFIVIITHNVITKMRDIICGIILHIISFIAPIQIPYQCICTEEYQCPYYDNFVWTHQQERKHYYQYHTIDCWSHFNLQQSKKSKIKPKGYKNTSTKLFRSTLFSFLLFFHNMVSNFILPPSELSGLSFQL